MECWGWAIGAAVFYWVVCLLVGVGTGMQEREKAKLEAERHAEMLAAVRAGQVQFGDD